MLLTEIAYPSGALAPDERAALASLIRSGLLDGDGAPEETMRRARTMTHIAFRELVNWTTGNGATPAGGTPPIWVTMTVPEAWRDDIARTMIGLIRASVRRLDRDHGWERAGGDLWINVVGITDGSIGLNGKPSAAEDVVLYMTEEFRAKESAGGELPDGVLLDPICGMQVRLGRDAITLDHDGETVGFCSKGCRSAYAKQRGLGGYVVSGIRRHSA